VRRLMIITPDTTLRKLSRAAAHNSVAPRTTIAGAVTILCRIMHGWKKEVWRRMAASCSEGRLVDCEARLASGALLTRKAIRLMQVDPTVASATPRFATCQSARRMLRQ
jgi:hypothetical protein